MVVSLITSRGIRVSTDCDDEAEGAVLRQQEVPEAAEGTPRWWVDSGGVEAGLAY